MSFFEWVKTKTSRAAGTVTKPRYEKEEPPEDTLSRYEIRREEVAAGTEPIEGIFYLHDGRIICDHYSECLESEDSWRKRHMYHKYFFRDYMLKKFPDLISNHEHVPRGRVSLFGTIALFIDACYCNDQELVEAIKTLYRLPEEVMIIDNYHCTRCRPESDTGLQ